MNPFDLFARTGGLPADSALTVLLTLTLAFVLGVSVAWLYLRTHQGLSYSRNMVHSLVLLCMIVSMVMLVVGDSIATAFGLVGALAIIRFRTVVRDARDTTFIFLALSVGIAVGVHQYAAAVAGTVGIGAVAALLQSTGFATRSADTGILRVHGTRTLGEGLGALLDRFCRSHELVSVRDAENDRSEYSYRIRLYLPSQQDELLREVRQVNGTSRVTVMLDEGAEEW